MVTESRRAEVSDERIIDVIGEDKAETLNTDAGLTLKPKTQRINDVYTHQPLQSFESKNLSYDYGDGNGFFNVSFQVNPGELTVIAGGIGSGKSTLLSVLMGLFPSDSGKIHLDGKQVLEDYSTTVKIAGAPQRGGFFSKDLKENLCLGFPASQDEIMSALSVVGLVDLIADNTHGYDLEVGSQGAKLSGGQQQRLAMARILVRGAQLNVIDDCVSALDEETRQKVLLRLLEHIKETSQSIIIATNEKVFLEAANNILFMESGRLISQGSFSELMENMMFNELVSQS